MLKTNPYIKAYLNTIIKENINNIEKYQQIAKIIGGEYIIENNAIDCKGHKIRFQNWWLNEEGTFDFKLINTSNDWSDMFKYCKLLTHLPDDFTIPNSVVDCSYMFTDCNSLTYLPNNFTIPNNVKDCSSMFYCCTSLTHLPDNFTIPNNVTNCQYMFNFCIKLTHLPENFHISDNAIYDSIFNNCNKLENKDPEAYRM